MCYATPERTRACCSVPSPMKEEWIENAGAEKIGPSLAFLYSLKSEHITASYLQSTCKLVPVLQAVLLGLGHCQQGELFTASQLARSKNIFGRNKPKYSVMLVVIQYQTVLLTRDPDLGPAHPAARGSWGHYWADFASSTNIERPQRAGDNKDPDKTCCSLSLVLRM